MAKAVEEKSAKVIRDAIVKLSHLGSSCIMQTSVLLKCLWAKQQIPKFQMPKYTGIDDNREQQNLCCVVMQMIECLINCYIMKKNHKIIKI